MKVLFVCRANVGRSQMAAALYNKLTKSKNADSAGAIVKEREGEKIAENDKAIFVVQVMKEEGLDISECTRKQLTHSMMDNFDKVIVMCSKEDISEDIKDSNKLIFWDVEDPKGSSYEFHLKIKNQIKSLVENLIDNNT